MSVERDRSRPRRAPRSRALLLAAGVAVLTLLAAGCSGGPAKAGGSSSLGGLRVQKLDSFAACMRGHGVLNFYFSPKSRTPSPDGGTVLSVLGFQVTGVNPQSPQFQAGMKACRHILGLRPPTQAVQHQAFIRALKSAACMRSHGYPSWPDPQAGPNGQGIMIPEPPAAIDTSSPQFQAAQKACGA